MLQINAAPRKVAPVQPVDLASLQNASQVLNEQFVKDAQAVPDVGETFSIRTCRFFLCLTVFNTFAQPLRRLIAYLLTTTASPSKRGG